jgi:hypothetical protein
MILILLPVFLAILYLALAALYARRTHKIPFLAQKDRWAIALWRGPSPLHLASGRDAPALTAADVTDVQAEFVADPFLVREGGLWHLFFEVLNRRSALGEIGHATSRDGVLWRYDRIVLKEPFHLSYPQVFRWEGEWYMVPESMGDRSVRLYRASAFPGGWELASTLLSGQGYVDPTLLRHEGRWWLFVIHPKHHLHLYFSEALEGPWREHPQSPLLQGDPHAARPAGRVVSDAGRLIRFSQDGVPWYGRRVLAFEITELTPERYRERPLGPVLLPGEGWNRDGMHHLDPQPDGEGGWIAAVDGFRKYWSVEPSRKNWGDVRQTFFFPWRLDEEQPPKSPEQRDHAGGGKMVRGRHPEP